MEKETLERIDIYRGAGSRSGPSVTITGAVHGNEKSGTKAVNKLIGYIDEGLIRLNAGNLTLMPIVNPRAYDENKRFIDENLNRLMYRRLEDEIVDYEDRLRNVVCPILEQTDFLQDNHSCTAISDVFSIVSGDITNQDNLTLARGIGVSNYIWDWQAVVESGNTVNADPRYAHGMTEYTREHGGQGMTIECGNHEHPQGPDFAFQAACNLLQRLGVATVDPDIQTPEIFKPEKTGIRLRGAVFKTQPGALCQDWHNMQPIREGTPIARFNDGQTVTMPKNGYIVMPNKNAGLNAEWFYWGVKESIPSL